MSLFWLLQAPSPLLGEVPLAGVTKDPTLEELLLLDLIVFVIF